MCPTIFSLVVNMAAVIVYMCPTIFGFLVKMAIVVVTLVRLSSIC